MYRKSEDDIDRRGIIKNGYDYQLQVWVEDYVIMNCNHPESMRTDGKICCQQWILQGKDIRTIKGHEIR